MSNEQQASLMDTAMYIAREYGLKKMRHFWEYQLRPFQVRVNYAVMDKSTPKDGSQILMYLRLCDMKKDPGDNEIYEGTKMFPIRPGLKFSDIKRMIRVVIFSAMSEIYFDCLWAD